MASSVGENGFHIIEVKSQSDDLLGDEVTAYYVRGDETIAGDTQTGVAEGQTMIFTTDLAEKGIGPGLWRVQFTRLDSGTQRQIGIEGGSRNQRKVKVTDAGSID